MSVKLEQMFNEIQQQGISSAKNVVLTGTTVTLPASTTIGGSSVSALGVITSASANALTVGLNGATNPAFNVDSSTGSQAAGLNIVGATAAGTVAAAVISSGAAANLTLDALGTGTIGIGTVSTGALTLGPATVNVASGATLAGLGTGSNGFTLKNLKNSSHTSLSGTQLDIQIDIAGVPYYFSVSPTKA